MSAGFRGVVFLIVWCIAGQGMLWLKLPPYVIIPVMLVSLIWGGAYAISDRATANYSLTLWCGYMFAVLGVAGVAVRLFS